MPAIVIVLILIESLLLLISNLVRIPEYVSIVVGCILVLAVWLLWRGKYKSFVKISLTIFSFIAICWALYSAYVLPYWNSITYLDLVGTEYPVSKGLDETLSLEEARQDYSFAVKQLKKVHPAFLDDAGRCEQISLDPPAAWPDSISVCHFYQSLQTTVASLGDAHTKVFPVLRERRQADYSDFGDIVSINDIPREEFVASFGRYISSETKEWTDYRIVSWLNDIEKLKLFGLFDKDSVSVVFDSPETGHIKHIFKDCDFKYRGRNASSNSLSTEYNGRYGFVDTISCGYLRLDNLINYMPKARRRFRQGMKDFFSQLSQKHYNHLIIDLRGNPGGNVGIARELFRYFPADEIKMGARYDRRGRIISKKSVLFSNREREEACFNGDVYVLTSVSTFSAAMHLADYLQGNGLAKIVGESPGNTPTCYTNIAHFVLPNSRLSLNISTEKFIRADETQEDNIIKPDLPCKASSAYETLKEYLLSEK